MVIDIPLSQLMSKQVISLDIYEDLESAEKLMRKNHIRHLPITRDGVLNGMLSLTDLQRISFASSVSESDQNIDSEIYDMFTIEQIMTHHPLAININDGMVKALLIFSEKEFHALPVVDDGKIVGILTTTDIIKYFLKVCEI
jgi:signal-transduction protein with cAMP-binding, CBS, and nucleotidyltransferase domain